MIATSGSSGLYGCPVTKVLLCHAVTTYILFTFPLQHFQYLLHYNQDVFAKQQFKRMFLSKLVFLDLPELLFSCLLIYNFRIFERRFGSRKYLSHMLCTALVEGMLELAVFALINRYNVKLDTMPTGLLSFVFPLYVPFYRSIPRVALTRIMGIPVTGKTLNYIIGLQMASSRVETMLVLILAVIAGVLWRLNFLGLQRIVCIPPLVGHLFDKCLGKHLDAASAPKTSELPMGATLELQRRERLDRLEQHMMMAATMPQGRARMGGIFNRQLFQPQNNGANNQGHLGDATTPVSEDQVRRFVEMGFTDARARQALRTSNNDPRLATNLLLQGVS